MENILLQANGAVCDLETKNLLQKLMPQAVKKRE